MENSTTTDVVINNCFGGYGLSKECITRIQEIFLENGENMTRDDVRLNFDCTNNVLQRSHPYLVQAVRELEERANDEFAELVIESIPTIALDSARIADYDGGETLRWNILTPMIRLLDEVIDVDSLDPKDARSLVRKLKDLVRQQKECTH